MEELTNKIDQVLAAVAAQSGGPLALSAKIGSRTVLAKLSNDSVEEVELLAHELLGIGDDPDKIADLLRKRNGKDIVGVEIVGTPAPHKEVLSWCESLSACFGKAWVSKLNLTDFIEKLCDCGEGLQRHRLYDIAFSEVYDRYADRMVTLKEQVEKSAADKTLAEADVRKVSSCLRFYLGRCMSLYQRSILRDEGARRKDTIECLRDVLKDIVLAVQFLNKLDESVREQLYWATVNAGTLAKRVARWLRLHGFGGAALFALRWLAQSKNTCLPLMAMHLMPMRMRFYLELIYCSESAQLLGEAQQDTATAIQQIEEVQKLESMLTPVPEETMKMLDTMLSRFRMLKIKYDFWLQPAVPDAKGGKEVPFDVKALLGEVVDPKAAKAPPPKGGEAAPPPEAQGPSRAVPCLLEIFHIQHGLRWHFGSAAEAAEEMPETSVEGGPEVTKFTYEQVDAKQRDLLVSIITEVKPHMEKIVEITDFLEEFTARRLAFEEDRARRARGEEGPRGEDGEELEALEEPAKPEKEVLVGMGMDGSVNVHTGVHTIEEIFPLSAHIALSREVLRQEMRGLDPKLQGEFELLEISLALRLRYRHFLRPPLVDLDITETPQKNRDEVELLDGYEFLTDDLNIMSLRNRKIEAEEAAEKANQEDPKSLNPVLKVVHREKPQGKHVFIIGQRFNAWKSWTSEHPTQMKRICNLRVVFGSRPASGGMPDEETTLGSFSFFDTMPTHNRMQLAKPWADAYHTAGAADNSGFDHVPEAKQVKELLMQDLRVGMLLSQRYLALPIEPHPGSKDTDVLPFVVFDVYDERSMWMRDEHAQQLTIKVQDARTKKKAVEGEEAVADAPTDLENLLPPWCDMLDKADLAADPIQDLSVVATKYLQAKVPNARMNGLIRADLRQTPGELLGLPLQSYFFMCASVDTPSTVFVAKQLRLMHAFHGLHKAMATAADESGVDEDGQYHRPEVISRLLELCDCLDRVLTGPIGRLFLLDSADILEDICGFVFLKIVWPRLRFIQERLQQNELYERMLTEVERKLLSEWSMVFRRIMPIVLRTLENVHAIDALTLASAAYALARLFVQDNDSRSAQVELGMAIVRLENELVSLANLGPQPQMDRPVAAAVSFDPPGLRAAGFEPYHDAAHDGCANEADKAVLLSRLSRLDQERITLLAQLYEQWIDCSLKVHFKNVKSKVLRACKPGEEQSNDLNAITIDTGSTKLTLSNPEADLLARLGENPYLRCLFFVTVAQRRPDVATIALGKACVEADLASSQEQQLWDFCEKELIYQQTIARQGSSFAEAFVRKKPQTGKVDPDARKPREKPRAHPPLVFARSPRCIRLRTPPLMGASRPPVLPAACQLKPAPLEYTELEHCQQMCVRENTKIVLTCAVLGKESGAGTAVSEVHRLLPGTAVRIAGNEFLELAGLKPNTNYSFASMYFEGFEMSRPSASTVSETTPPIGTYHPLPLVLLRIGVCKAIIRLGLMAAPVWTKAWAPLFVKFCERTTAAEEFDSCGLRTFKLRIDVADRMPPVLLSAFAEVILLKNRLVASDGNTEFPSTRPVQQTVLRSANECLVAVDCASRAGDGFLAAQAVSTTVRLVRQLLQYRTKPPVILSLLTRCAAALEVLQLPQYNLAWYAQARVMTTYLFHQIAVLSVQIWQPTALSKQLDADDAQRFVVGPLADPVQADAASARVLDAALELALLGEVGWPRGEGKARAALAGRSNLDDLVKLLKDFSERNYNGVAKDASLLALSADEAKQPNALSFMQCAVGRTWHKGGIGEILAEALTKHPLSESLTQFLQFGRKRFEDYGFMLRALPPVRIELPASAMSEPDSPAGSPRKAEDEAGEAPAAAGDDAVEAAPTEEELLTKFAGHGDTAPLAQLELIQAAPLLQELCSLRFHWHDISRFKYLDLSQISVPKLASEESLGKTDLGLTETGEIGGAAADELDEWQVKEQENHERRKHSLEVLQKLLRPLARAATLASAKQADQLLQSVIVSILNALYIVGPTPEECVPSGSKANPEDEDPDMFVGGPKGLEVKAEGEEAAVAEGEEPPVDDNDMWLNLALLAELAVSSLKRLKKELTRPQKVKAVAIAKPKFSSRPPEVIHEEERRTITEAESVCKAMDSVDEEVQENWFEMRPDLDLTCFAKVIAFAALCLYHMRRWDNVVKLCWNFNDATCNIYATTFLPLAIGAQCELCNLSKQALANTERYIMNSKMEFEENQKKLPRKELRQLALRGALSIHEKLFRHRNALYTDILQRQNKLDAAWRLLSAAVDNCHTLVTRAVPAALEQLRNSRILLANFLEDKQALNIAIRRGLLSTHEKAGRERVLRLAATALISSYRKSVELLRKRQMIDQVVQAMHELGNLQWLQELSGDARASWSDALDVSYQYVYAIKNWQDCLETAVKPPQDFMRVERMMLTATVLAKYARFTLPGNATAHLHASLFASGIIETVLTSALPHPTHRENYAPNKYRMRELFFGLRESHLLLPPSSVHGGLDGLTFLGCLAFIHNTLLSSGYQVARCLPICSLYNYIATDICRDTVLAVKGRLMMARALLNCRELTSTWLALYAISRNHDLPRPVLTGDSLDKSILDVQEMVVTVPYRTYEEPWSETNVKAANQLAELVIAPVNDVDPMQALGAYNMNVFLFLQAEFLVTISSYGRVSKISDPEEKERLGFLDKADQRLTKLWTQLTKKDDDVVAWSAGRADGLPMVEPGEPLNEEDSQLCVDIRLLRAQIAELRGDLARAVVEILHAMHFVQLLAGLGAAGGMRKHPDMKAWMSLRRRMVQLLMAQGRFGAADSHIEKGLQECADVNDDLSRVELFAAKARIQVLNGSLLEVRGAPPTEVRSGALVSVERCLAVVAKSLPVATPSALSARMMLAVVLRQNPALVKLSMNGASKQSAPAAPTGKKKSEEDDIEAQQRVLMSPIAQQLQAKSSGPMSFDQYRESQKYLVELMILSIEDIDKLLQFQGFALHTKNRNNLFNVGLSDDVPEPTTLAFLPPMRRNLRERPESDAREPPNVYLELMPMRCCYELALINLCLELGDFSAPRFLLDLTKEEAEKVDGALILLEAKEAAGERVSKEEMETVRRLRDFEVCRRLLKEAETRATRCMHFLPWLQVQLCLLKLRWRRLDLRIGVASKAKIPKKTNHVIYCDPKTFAAGVCPPTTSPVFRTFVSRATTPELVEDTEWVIVGQVNAEGSLERYMQELLIIIRIALQEGGHDYTQLRALFREGVEEVVRSCSRGLGKKRPESSSFDLLYALFSCVVAVVEARKSLQFELSGDAPPVAVDPKAKAPAAAAGVPPPPITVASLPVRVGLDLQAHLKRQDNEGALGYSSNALADSKNSLLFSTVVKHSLALRRECDTFSNIFQADRLLCDQLHVNLSVASEPYKKARVVDDALLVAVETPVALPTTGDVLIQWMPPDPPLQAPPDSSCVFLAFICTLGEDPETAAPMVARSPVLQRATIRRLLDSLAIDLDHCKPAAAATGEYLEQRLRTLAKDLRGLVRPSKSNEDYVEPVDPKLDAALLKLLLSLQDDDAEPPPVGEDGEALPPTCPKLLSAAKVQRLLRALIRLLDVNSRAERVTHQELSTFLRTVFTPLSVFPQGK